MGVGAILNWTEVVEKEGTDSSSTDEEDPVHLVTLEDHFSWTDIRYQIVVLQKVDA